MFINILLLFVIFINLVTFQSIAIFELIDAIIISSAI